MASPTLEQLEEQFNSLSSQDWFKLSEVILDNFAARRTRHPLDQFAASNIVTILAYVAPQLEPDKEIIEGLLEQSRLVGLGANLLRTLATESDIPFTELLLHKQHQESARK